LDDAGSILPEQRANFFQTTWESGLTEDIARRGEASERSNDQQFCRSVFDPLAYWCRCVLSNPPS
jgi:hypothetical protein